MVYAILILSTPDRSNCPEGAMPHSPGLPLRLPWELSQASLNRDAVESVITDGRNPDESGL